MEQIIEPRTKYKNNFVFYVLYILMSSFYVY